MIYSLIPDQTIVYTPDVMYGSYEKPVIFSSKLQIQQTIELQPTWTWFSLNVKPDDTRFVEGLLNEGTWQKGDQLKYPEEKCFFNYNDGKWTCSNTELFDSLDNSVTYIVKSQKSQKLVIEGSPLVHFIERLIYIHEGWNFIGYTPTQNLTIQEALADFYGHATEGDIIKSQSEFATFSKAYGWTGNLKYMKPGEGYMLKHSFPSNQTDTTIAVLYPYKSIDGEVFTTSLPNPEDLLFRNTKPTTMTVVAQADGVETQVGDRLLAYADGELCGIAEAVELKGNIIFFLSIGGDENKPLSYTLERNGEVVGGTAAIDTYRANATEGTAALPKVISFREVASWQQGVWYSLEGINLGRQRPSANGVYIYNGEKVVIQK